MPPEEFRKAPFLRLIFPLAGGILLGRLLHCPDWVGWGCIVVSSGSVLVSCLYRRRGSILLLMCFFFLGLVMGRKPVVPVLPAGLFTGRICADVVSSGKGTRILIDRIRYIDQDRCIPRADNQDCIVCEEMCPVPDKAVKLEEVEVGNADREPVSVQCPHVIRERCTGCGICEYRCPLNGEAAIRVYVPSAGV